MGANKNSGNVFQRSMTMTKKLGKVGPLVALLLLVLIMSVLSDSFFQASNLLNIIQQTSVNMIMAMGMTLILISGGIDLSVGSVLALSGTSMALLATKVGLPSGIAIILGIGVAVLIGVINGFIISKTGIPDFIMTMGMLSIARSLALVITGGLPVSRLPESMTMVGATRLFGVIPFSGIVAMIITVLFWFIMKYTKIGRCAYAIGGNKEAARASGINTFLYKILFNALMGFTVGVASLVQIGRIYSANPVMGSGQELQVIAMVIIGGTNLNGGEGNIGGTVIGALIMGIIANGLNLLNVSSFWQQFFIGAIIVLVVVIDQLKHKKN